TVSKCTEGNKVVFAAAMVELTSGYFGDGSRDREDMGRNEGDDDGGILSS
ncbi:hypothetical protein Tco_0609841, partial [Tanacetum coccineum]